MISNIFFKQSLDGHFITVCYYSVENAITNAEYRHTTKLLKYKAVDQIIMLHCFDY